MFVSGACTSNLQFVDKHSMAHVFFVWVIYWEFVGLFCTSAPLEYIYTSIYDCMGWPQTYEFSVCWGTRWELKSSSCIPHQIRSEVLCLCLGKPPGGWSREKPNNWNRKTHWSNFHFVLTLEHVALRDPTGRMIMAMILWSSLESEQNIVASISRNHPGGSLKNISW